MKRTLTSIVLHKTAEGQRVSFTYSEVDEETELVMTQNNRASVVVLDIEKNAEVLAAIQTVTQYVEGKLE